MDNLQNHGPEKTSGRSKLDQIREIPDPFRQLVAIMAVLRSPEGCPWDRKQTHQSLRQFLLEETFETLECLDQNDLQNLKEELGDLLLQIVFHAQIAAEEKAFTIDDVIRSINEKLIRRHPNVFGETRIETPEEQSRNWERLKREEGRASVLSGVPKYLPALLRAYRIQAKASHVGFDWQDVKDVWKKVEEELRELKENIERNHSKPDIEEEFGDLLFALVNLSRFIGVNPEDALRATIEKFIRRFQRIEEELARKGKTPEQSSLEEMDAIWNRVKNEEE